MSNSELDLPASGPSRTGGLQVTEDLSGTRLTLSWSGPKPWGYLRTVVPLAVVSVFVLLGSGQKGPWMLAWQQLTARGQHDVVEDIFLGVIICGGLIFAWYLGSLLGQIGGYWSELTFDANEQLLTAERRGWLLWGRKSIAVLFPQMQHCSLRTGRENRAPFLLNLDITTRNGRDRVASLNVLSFKFSLIGCHTRTQALELLLAIGRVLSAKGYLKGEETPFDASWQLVLNSTIVDQSAPSTTEGHEFDEDLEDDELFDDDDNLDDDDENPDEEDDADDHDAAQVSVIPIPSTSELGQQVTETAGAATVAVDHQLAARVNLEQIRESISATQIEEWKPGEYVRFMSARAPFLVFVIAAIFGAAVGAGIGGWPVFGVVEGLIGSDSLWWPGALILSALTGACVSGFIAWNQLQQRSVEIDYRNRIVTYQSSQTRHEYSFDQIKGLLLSGTQQSTSDSDSSSSSTVNYGCRLDLITTEQDIPLIATEDSERDHNAARKILQPLGSSLAQSLGLKCDWQSYHRLDPNTARRLLTFSWGQYATLGVLVAVAVVGIGQGYTARQARVQARDQAGRAIRELGGEAVWMSGFSQSNKSVYRDYWNVEFKADPSIDEHLARLRPGLNKVPELGINFEECPLSDIGIEQLKDAVGLRVLTASNTRITDVGLRSLGGCTNLVYMNLYGNNITDGGLDAFAGLSKLRFLFLGGTQVTDQGLVELGKLPSLEYLHLTNSAVTPEGVAKLRATRPRLEVEFFVPQ